MQAEASCALVYLGMHKTINDSETWKGSGKMNGSTSVLVFLVAFSCLNEIWIGLDLSLKFNIRVAKRSIEVWMMLWTDFQRSRHTWKTYKFVFLFPKSFTNSWITFARVFNPSDLGEQHWSPTSWVVQVEIQLIFVEEWEFFRGMRGLANICRTLWGLGIDTVTKGWSGIHMFCHVCVVYK